jgi:glycosyltransferase involved in cell wall biosynthesis
MRVAIAHQGFIPHYRVRFFEKLNAGSSEFVVFHGSPPTSLGHHRVDGPFAFPNVAVHNREISVAGRSAIYQPILRGFLSGRFDAVVMGSHLQFVSNHAVLAQRKLFRQPVLYWGHGPEKGMGVRLKYLLARLPDGYLVYSGGGAEHLIANNVRPERITVVPNTLDMESEIRLYSELQDVDEVGLRRRLGLRETSVVLTYIGRLYAKKRVVDLIATARALAAAPTNTDFEVVIIGDGPESGALRAAATGLANVHLIGPVYDARRVAEYLRVTSAVAMPGHIGLVANHALAHGVPLLHRRMTVHSAEMEYLTPGEDLLIADSDSEFATLLTTFINSPDLRSRTAQAALRARDRSSLDAMVTAFQEGVAQTVARVAHRTPAADTRGRVT